MVRLMGFTPWVRVYSKTHYIENTQRDAELNCVAFLGDERLASTSSDDETVRV